jgi:nicotinamidase-related amidase
MMPRTYAARASSFTAPILVALGIQREYTMVGRPCSIPGIVQSLGNCRRLLDHARSRRWIVAHVRHIQDGPLFSDRNEYAACVPGFEPLPGEPVFEKSRLSCLSSPGFGALVDAAANAGSEIYLMGYAGEACCLATLVGLYDLGIQANYVIDASLSRPGPRMSAQARHAYVAEILTNYANILETFDVVSERALRAV